MSSNIVVGSVVYLVIGIVLIIISQIKINSMNLNEDGEDTGDNRLTNELKSAHKCTACVSIVLGTVCCWIMWICTYMHQMHPLIQPILEHKA